MMISITVLVLVTIQFAAHVAAQEVMGAWNRQSPPSCVGTTVTLTYTKNFGASDYQIVIDWGDATTSPLNTTATVEDGETLSYSHEYPAGNGSFTIVAKALVVSFQTEIGYTDTLTLGDTGCSFEAFPPTVSPKPTPSPTSFPTIVVPTIPPSRAPTMSPKPTLTNPSGTVKTSSPTSAPTSTPDTMADFVATSDKNNPSDTSQHYIVRITDPSVIEMARNEVMKRSGFLLVSGTIDKQQTTWNPNWTFYMRPSTVTLTDIYSETCDVTVKFIQLDFNNAGETFLPNLQWCPSQSRILREIDASLSEPGTSDSESSPSDSGSSPVDNSPATAPSSASSSNGADGASDNGGSGNEEATSSAKFAFAFPTLITACLCLVAATLLS